MKISSRGRYALASMVVLAERYNSKEPMSAINVSGVLGISKIYLEQVFSLLKKASLVVSSKGPKGGYRLVSKPSDITAYDILKATEVGLFEKDKDSVLAKNCAHLEKTIGDLVMSRVDETLVKTLEDITLDELLSEAEKNRNSNGNMFFI